MRRIILSCALLQFATTGVAANAIQPLPSIEQAVHAFVADQQDERADVEFSIGRLDPRLRLPLCELPLETRNTHAPRARGPMSVEVRCSGAKPWVLYVPVMLVRYARVAVALRPIVRNAPIVDGDLEIQRRRIDARQGDYLTDAAMARGQVAIRSISSGQAVTHSQLKLPHLVRRGDHVVLSMGNRSVNVKVKGEALENGTAGERISVLNLSSERIIEGVVISPGEVVVRTGTIL